MSVVYGTLYLCFAAFPIVYKLNRGWSAGIGGLAFIGVLVGFFIGCVYIWWDNGTYARLYRENNNHPPPPECRLPACIAGGAAVIGGLAWFAATNGPSVPWPASVCAGIPFGFGFILVFVACGNYL
jgi:uncharacterized membrane protein (DUF485 family)